MGIDCTTSDQINKTNFLFQMWQRRIPPNYICSCLIIDHAQAMRVLRQHIRIYPAALFTQYHAHTIILYLQPNIQNSKSEIRERYLPLTLYLSIPIRLDTVPIPNYFSNLTTLAYYWFWRYSKQQSKLLQMWTDQQVINPTSLWNIWLKEIILQFLQKRDQMSKKGTKKGPLLDKSS